MDEIKRKIETYFSNKMTPQELEAFEDQLREDPELLQAFAKFRKENPNVEVNYPDGGTQFHHNRKTTQTTNKKKGIRVIFGCAISIMILGLVMFLSLVNWNTGDLYSQYYTTADIPNIISTSVNDSDLELGTEAFYNEDYEVAWDKLSTYLFSSPNPIPAVYIYSGISNLEMGNHQDAINDFDILIAMNTVDSSKGLWFKALAYLRIEDEVNAKTTLQQIASDPSNFNYYQALEILQIL